MTQGGCPHVRNSNHRPIKVGVSQCYNGGLYLPNETCSLQYPVRRATFPLSVSPPPSSALPRSFPPSGGLFRRNITLQMAARLLISPSQSRPRGRACNAGEQGSEGGGNAQRLLMPLIIPFSNLRLSPLTHSNSELAEIQIVSLKNKMHSRGKTRDGPTCGRRTIGAQKYRSGSINSPCNYV